MLVHGQAAQADVQDLHPQIEPMPLQILILCLYA
jgi:hypothetical protein